MSNRRRPRGTGSVQLHNGRVQAQIQINGKRYTRTFSRHLDAEDWLAKMRQRAQDGGQDNSGQNATFREVAEGFLKSKESSVKQSTYESYAYTLKRYVLPRLGQVPCAEIDASTIEQLFSEINSMVNEPRENRGAARVTTLVYRVLFMIFKFAHKRKWIEDNPMETVAAPKRIPRPGKALTVEQQKILLETVKALEPGIYSMVVIALWTGMRKGELLGLTWQNVDFENGSIYVCQQARWVENEMQVVSVKTESSRRYIPLHSLAAQVLKDQQQHIEMMRQIARRWDENDLVFPSTVGTLLGASAVSKRFKRCARKCGLGDFRFHDLRHTFVTNLLKGGIEITSVQRIAGHAHLQTTLRYVHMVGINRSQVNRVLDDLGNELLREK